MYIIWYDIYIYIYIYIYYTIYIYINHAKKKFKKKKKTAVQPKIRLESQENSPHSWSSNNSFSKLVRNMYIVEDCSRWITSMDLQI